MRSAGGSVLHNHHMVWCIIRGTIGARQALLITLRSQGHTAGQGHSDLKIHSFLGCMPRPHPAKQHCVPSLQAAEDSSCSVGAIGYRSQHMEVKPLLLSTWSWLPAALNVHMLDIHLQRSAGLCILYGKPFCDRGCVSTEYQAVSLAVRPGCVQHRKQSGMLKSSRHVGTC